MRHKREARGETGSFHPFRTQQEGGALQPPGHGGQQPGPPRGGPPDEVLAPEVEEEPQAHPPGVLSPVLEEVCSVTASLKLC